ncbi:MAG: hypothetical protein MJ016_06750, partial [Victivallaceae bacterium]|nr:hypothetical protein [Victivallaceae bacterium]
QLHTRIMLWGTFFLLFGGMLVLYYAESEWSLFDSFFMSASARTAGFSCCKLESDIGYDVLMFLMEIGGGSGGTAGGIKMTTFVIACAAIVNTSIGNKDVHLFGYTINPMTVLRAFSLIIYFRLVLFASLLLLEYLSPDIDSGALYFDAVSALSTTGLTEGAVVKLGASGKLVISLLMYTGRVGPLTFLLFLFGRQQLKQIDYPEGDIIIG